MFGSGFSGLEPFKPIKSRVVPFDRANVDTDQIVPKQFLKQTAKTGYGKYLFFDWRYYPDGRQREEFILNQQRFQGRKILLTRENFGIGSSREHAVWALYDYGFRAIIAPSFGDIFYENSFKNGLLAVRLERDEIEFLFEHECEVEIELESQVIRACGTEMKFKIDPFKKKMLLGGLDPIGLAMRLDQYISNYERGDSVYKPIAS